MWADENPSGERLTNKRKRDSTGWLYSSSSPGQPPAWRNTWAYVHLPAEAAPRLAPPPTSAAAHPLLANHFFGLVLIHFHLSINSIFPAFRALMCLFFFLISLRQRFGQRCKDIRRRTGSKVDHCRTACLSLPAGEGDPAEHAGRQAGAQGGIPGLRMWTLTARRSPMRPSSSLSVCSEAASCSSNAPLITPVVHPLSPPQLSLPLLSLPPHSQ
jgi:hypothetical protein